MPGHFFFFFFFFFFSFPPSCEPPVWPVGKTVRRICFVTAFLCFVSLRDYDDDNKQNRTKPKPKKWEKKLAVLLCCCWLSRAIRVIIFTVGLRSSEPRQVVFV
jgi:hypothetical protein